MKIFRHCSRLQIASIALVCATGFLGIAASEAQEIGEDSITIEAGTLLELMTVADSPDAHYGWVLTEDRQFLEASRGPVFRVRIAKPGDYRLDASAVTPDQSLWLRRVIRLHVTIPSVPNRSGGTGSNVLVNTQPPLEMDSIVLKLGGGLILLEPGKPGVLYELDTDELVDSNQDGDRTNDVDSDKTFFRTDGSPLYLWIASVREKRVLNIRTVAPDGEIRRQKITIYGNESAVDHARILTTEKDNGAVEFSVQFRGNEPPEDPLLYRWNFGDNQGSLEDIPAAHRFARNGEYVVRVEVVSLTTGTVLMKVEKNMKIVNVTADPAPQTTMDTPETQKPYGGGSIVWTMLKGLLGLLTASGLGFLLMYLLKRLKGGEGLLQKKLADIENTLAPRQPTTSSKNIIDVAPAPMELKRSEKSGEPAASSASEKPKAPKEKEEAPTPPWLRKGLDRAPTAEPPKTAATPVAPSAIPKPPAAPPSKSAAVPAAPTNIPPPPRTPTPTPTPTPVAPAPSLPSIPSVLKQPESKALPPSTPTPTPTPTPVAPAPSLPSIPPVVQQPESKAPPTIKKELATEASSEPIAFIRAESLNEKKRG